MFGRARPRGGFVRSRDGDAGAGPAKPTGCPTERRCAAQQPGSGRRNGRATDAGAERKFPAAPRRFDDRACGRAAGPEAAFVAYVLGDANRPVTFLFNGGPGAASAYLNIGAVGPWRLPFENISASATPALLPNAETWLDFTDLVFIDPVLTGYSHIVASGDNVRRQFLSVDGDANALAVVIRKWVERNNRQGAVKFLVGESYGGFRVPKVAQALAGQQGVGVRGLIMISPA